MTDTHFLLKDFNESTYLKLNPDVSAAVEDRSFASGLEHCLTYGIYEDRPGLPPAIREHMNNPGDESKHPPGNLRSRVHGDESLQDFINVGKLLSYNLFSSFVSLTDKESGNRILDFGCGCGRVISFLARLLGNNRFHASDIDHEAIAWCRENLADVGEFTVNSALPPLPFENDYFDLVYSISVFTHLPEDMQTSWLAELQRITRKGGYLLLTIHGEDLAPQAIRQTLGEQGFFYSVGSGTDGLPGFYQTTFHTEQYIRRHWGSYFEIVRIVRRGILNHQDLVICRKPA
ncbi:MAG: class I SAM-dependent methyltransferase [Candidatus Thiodiazotropha sp.]